MNDFTKKYAETHKVLTLQITKEYFVKIMRGEHPIEHRFIYPNNATRYLVRDEEGNAVPRHYDALYLINGRRKDAPRMLVEVNNAEFIICIDEEGNDITFWQDGKEYYECQVWYHLGKVLDLENVVE